MAHKIVDADAFAAPQPPSKDAPAIGLDVVCYQCNKKFSEHTETQRIAHMYGISEDEAAHAFDTETMQHEDEATEGVRE